MNNKRQKLYENLIGTGRVSDAEIGTLDEFRSAIKDEQTARQFHKNLLGAGFSEDEIGSEDEFYNSISPDFVSNKSNTEPYTHEYGSDGSLIGGTALQEAGKPREVAPEVTERILANKPDYFKSPGQSLIDIPLGREPQKVELDVVKPMDSQFGRNYTANKVIDTINDVYSGVGYDYKAQKRIENAIEDSKNPEVVKSRTASQMRGLANDVDALLEEAHGKLKKKVPVGGNAMNALMSSRQYGQDNASVRQEISKLDAAKRLLEQSQNVVDEAGKKGKTNFVAGTLRGFWDNLEGEDFTFGAADASSSASILNALEKVEEGKPLTDAEDALLKASAINMAVQYHYANDLGEGYKAGGVTAESVPFMLEMLINPIAGFGKASAKTLLNYGLKAFAKNAVKGLAKGAVAGAGMAATTGLGNVVSGMNERLSGNYDYMVDNEGKLHVDKKDEVMGSGEALARSFASRAIENQSEMIFRAFDGAGQLLKGVQKYIPGGVNKFFSDIAESKVGQLYKGIKNSPLRKELAEATQVGGIGEEYLEEVYNNLANFAIGEMEWEDVVSLDKNIETLLGLAPTQAMFAMLGLGGMGVQRYNSRKSINNAFGKMSEAQKAKLKELQEMGKFNGNKDIAEFIKITIADKSLTPEEKRAEIEYAYNLAKQNAINEVAEVETQDRVEADNASIDAATDTQTGNYAQVTAILPDGVGGTNEVVGNVVGWIGDSPIFVADGMENTEENRRVLKQGEWNPETLIARPAEEVKAINEDIIREEVAAQAERESKYAPEVLDKPMPEGEFVSNGKLYVPYQSTPDGVEYEVYELDEKGKPTTTIALEVKQLTIDDYHDMLQADLEAQEAVQAESASSESVGEQVNTPVNTEVNNPMENAESTPMSEEVQSATEEKSTQPVIPTKKDGSIDFVAYGREGTLKTLGEKYGEKLPNKVAVTAKALAEDVVKAEEKLAKAEEAYDNAPIGREQKAEEARDKARQELEEVKKEAEYWKAIDEEIKEAQKAREAIINPTVEPDITDEPMTTEEFVAKALADGGIRLTSDSYKKELGYGEKERKRFPKMFAKKENGGLSIEEAGEWLMQWDSENGTNFFDQEDANAGRDALINFLGSVRTWGDITGYIRRSREQLAERESEGLRNEVENAIESNYHMTPEEYATLQEVESVENPFGGLDVATKDAIFVEAYEEYEQSLNPKQNDEGRTSEIAEGNGAVLSEERTDNEGGTSERQGERPDLSEGAVQQNDAAQEAEQVEEPLTIQEGESPVAFAERVLEEQRRKPLRNRANEWAKALGVKVHFIERLEDVENQAAYLALSNGSKVAGWYEGATGEVFLYMPNLDNIAEVDKTYIHEVVAHKGLREMLGKERFNELCDKVWDMMPDKEKAEFIQYEGVNGDTRAAADEYIAYLAEKENLTPEEKTIWDSIVKMFRDMLDRALNGIIGKSKLTDEDISNLIKASYANLKSGAEGAVGEGTRFSVKPIGVGAFGNIYNQFKGKAKEAIRFLMQIKEGEAIGALYHPEIGDIDLVWGKEGTAKSDGYGLSKLVKYHPEVLDNLQEILNDMHVTKRSDNRVKLESETHQAAVRLTWDNVKKNWLLTAFEKGNSAFDNTTDTDETSERGKRNDTATPQNTVSDNKYKVSDSEKQEKIPLFRVVNDKNGKKTLVGLHNISEEKLRKAIKQGGLANPSMAVIDMDKQSHVDYGDITLVAPESLVDKKLGKNIGTYMADAYTPIYPTVVKQMTDKGYKAFNNALDDVNEVFRSKVRSYFKSYLDSGTVYDALYYWYLSDTGNNPPTLEAALPGDFTREEVDKVKSINPEADSFFQLSEEDKQKALAVYADKFYGGIEKYQEYLADYINRMREVVKDESKPAMVRNRIQRNLNEIENYGFEYDYVAAYYNRGMTLANRQSKPSDVETFSNARNEVIKKGLTDELKQWLAEKEADFGVEEKLFKGYDNQGRAKYVSNTLENASKLMKKEGRAGATGYGGFNEFVAVLAPVAKTTKELNKKKQNLSTKEAYDEFVEQWSGHYHDLAKKLQPGADKWADYGYHRLQEIAPMANPRDYVKREYGIELSDEFMKDLNDIKTAIKNDFPARYFETKFERPVYLNEFSAAVVPQGTSKDVVDALTEAGLQIEEYESGNNEARMAAVDKVSSETEGVRFRFIGERGARNLDKAEEATTRLDNLAVAREMEVAKKDAKAIKMATGWERGADGLWRYETMDSETAIKDGDEAEIRKQIEDIEEEEKAYKKKAKAEGIDEDERHEAYIRFYRRRGFLEAQLAYVMVKNADVLTHIGVSLYHVLDKENSENLFKAYPELEFVRVGFATEIHGKSLGATIVNGSRVEAIHLDVKRSTPEELNGYLAHEIQHAIQVIEGFAPGGEPSMESPRKAEQKSKNISFMKDKLDKSVSERKSLLKQRDEVNDKMSAWWAAHEDATRDDMLADKEMQQYNREYDELSKQIDEADKTVKFNERWLEATLQANTSLGYEGYKKLAGEVEARNVTSRLGMTPEQRRESLASETEDVARKDQIFLKDGVESGVRFRVIQSQVNEFTSKYNSKPVSVASSDMTDEELEKAVPTSLAEDTRKDIEEGLKGGYSVKADKIYIFADNVTKEELEDTLFHENLHHIISGKPMVEEFYNNFNEKHPEQVKGLAEGYKESDLPEEVFVIATTHAMMSGRFDIVNRFLSEESKNELLNILKDFGYDYEQERTRRINGRTDGQAKEGLTDVDEDKKANERSRGKENSEGQQGSSREQAEKLRDLFGRVADMGLDGVLGNEAYDRAMMDIYSVLPEDSRKEVIDDAFNHYGMNIAPAVSDYIHGKSDGNILDKIVAIIRNALRKVGFNIDLNGNEVKYLAWRSKKPLDRNNLVDMAEDIYKKYQLKVGEYSTNDDGTTPDGGGTRFRRVYHGSSASFDKFDHSFMGTGEGNQSFGWGSYVTDVKEVGEKYAGLKADNSPIASQTLRWLDENSTYEAFITKGEGARRKKTIANAKEFLKEMKEDGASEDVINAYEQDLKDAERAITEDGYNQTKENMVVSLNRHLYEVEIPDDNGSNYIAWDKMLPKEQAERIKDAIRNSKFFKEYEKDYKQLAEERLDAWTKTNGGRAYKLLGNIVWNEKDLSQILSEAGFAGFKYPTNYFSGGNEDGTNNYVIFNEDDLEIKGHTRFRVSNKLQVRDEYEETIRKGGYQAREAVQDAMLSLRRFQELIEKESGKKLKDFENAWMHENRLSSVVQAAIHEMERKFYKPMTESVKKLMKAADIKQEEVADYLMFKHGIERNREMAVRKALTDAEGKIDRAHLEQWYQDKEAIRNDANLDTWRKKQEAMDNLALNYGADMSRDYSGLTSMFDTDDIEECTNRAYDEVEALENAYPAETEALGKAVKAMTQNTLDESFRSGLMDRKVYDELSKDMYDYYIPLRGFEETTSEEVYAYLDQDRGAFNAPLKRAKGRSSKSDNPIAYLKSIAESGIMQGERNKMKQSFLNMVINHPSDLVSIHEGVWVVFNPATGEWEAAAPPAIPNNATPADVEAAMEAWEQQMEQAAQNDPTLVKKVAEAADVPYRVVGNRMNQHQIIVKRLGKSYTLTVNGNPRLAMALNGLTNPNNTSNDGKVSAYVSGKFGALNRFLASVYTTKNPDFVVSNFMRDTFYTNTIVRAKEGNSYANKFHKHYAELLMPGKMISLFKKYEKGTLDMSNATEAAFKDFMMNGGETGYSNLKDLENIKKQIAKELKGNRLEVVEKVAEKLDILNRAVENTARFAAYLTSREEGRSVAKSVFDAKEISVNFNKKGAGGTFFGMTGQTKLGNLAAMVGAGGRALYVFFNAAIQGTTNLLHVMKKSPKGTSAGIAAMFLMGAVLPFLLDDDEEKDYYDLPEHVRRNHLILPGFGDAWISIPLPIEYRIMYGMGELLTSWRTGHERGSDIGRKMLNLTGQALPLNFLEEGFDAFIPSSLSPLWQVYNNKSWTGLPLYKDNEFNKDDPEYTKAYKNVDKTLYNVSKALYDWTFDEENQEAGINLNPAVLEALARGYFGGFATQLGNLGKTWETIAGEREFDWRSIPIGNRVFKSGDERTKEKRITNEYFENMEKLDFMQSRERTLKKTINGVSVPQEDKDRAKEDYDKMKDTDIYKKYQEFKKKKKDVDKLRKRMKEQGSTEELEKKLTTAQEEANKVVR